MMLRRIDGACDSLLFVSSPRCENTTARQTAAHPLRGHTPLRRQHGEELEPSHRAFLRGSGSRINYSRSGPCTAAKATTQCPLWVISGQNATAEAMSALPPKADMHHDTSALCQSGLLQSSLAHAVEKFCQWARRVGNVTLDPGYRVFGMQFLQSRQRCASLVHLTCLRQARD